jgi:signal transduction histidine kinase
MGRCKLSVPPRLTAFVLAAMAWLAALHAEAGDDGQNQPPLVAIRDVLADVNAFARRRVLVKGVVTWRGRPGLIVQDDSGGIWVDTPREAPHPIALQWDPAELARLAPGLEIEVVGWTNRGGYMPNISPETIRILGAKPEPAPRSVDRDRFFSGSDDCLRVTVRGIVQGCRDSVDDWLLAVDDHGRRFTATVPKRLFPVRPESLIDAEVLLVGVGAMTFNTRGECLSPRLLVVHAGDIEVEQPPATTAFGAPDVPLDAIAQYRPEASAGHRIRTRGTVTVSEQGAFLYLQEGTMGVRVETQSRDRFVPGDRVEVAGFVTRKSDVAGIVEAVVRKLETDRPLEPIRISPDEILAINRHAAYYGAVATPGDYKGCLVTFPARVLDVRAAGPRGMVLLASGSASVVAEAAPAMLSDVRGINPGSLVRVTGIVQAEQEEPSGQPSVGGQKPGLQLRLLMRSAGDIAVVRRPSWWTPGRLVAALAVVGAAAGVAAGWVVTLRRQVTAQMAVIETKLQAEAATEERHRIAREFHDTLEQDLAGITLRLDAAAHRTADERSRAVLEEQRLLIARVQSETHDFLWDLRDPARNDGAIVESLASQTAYLQSLTDVSIRLDAATDLPRVPPLVQYQLLRIVREAVNNAIRHGDPTGIDVRLGASAAGLTLDVSDDGKGFDLAGCQAVAGHFGLRGMRERTRRIGAAFAIESRPGQGTRIEVRVPAASLDPPPEVVLSKPTMAAAEATGDDA